MSRNIHFLFLVLLLTACSKNLVTIDNSYYPNGKTDIPDYSNLVYWAAHPDKRDPSDSIPSPLRANETDQLADVFFIHPTTYLSKAEGHKMNADIADVMLNAKTDKSSILFQSSVFNNSSRVFAPRYRQAHISAFYLKNDAAETAFEIAYQDLKTAFEFYLKNYNNSRPIIIAGHSQGAKMSERLLKDYFENKPLQSQLVVAYLVGWPVSENYFSAIPMCKEPQQTGCVCSWRTFIKGYTPEFIKHEKFKALLTNPLSWTSNETPALLSENKGSVLRNFNKILMGVTDAQIHNNMLWVKKPRFPGGFFFFRRNYHIADFNLFYMNIRTNAKLRTSKFLMGK